MSYSQAERALIYKIRKDWIAYTNSLPAGSSPLPVSRWLEIQADSSTEEES
jgi:hypothetical protein